MSTFQTLAWKCGDSMFSSDKMLEPSAEVRIPEKLAKFFQSAFSYVSLENRLFREDSVCPMSA